VRFFKDGDQLAIVKDDFIDLASSPAVFFPLESEIAQAVLETGDFSTVPPDDLRRVSGLLEAVVLSRRLRKEASSDWIDGGADA
jgi:hypothetical protein